MGETESPQDHCIPTGVGSPTLLFVSWVGWVVQELHWPVKSSGTPWSQTASFIEWTQKVDILGHSETIPGSVEINRGYTYCMSDVICRRGIALGISWQLQPLGVATLTDEHIMLVRLKPHVFCCRMRSLKLKRRYSKPNSTLYWSGAFRRALSLFWVTSMLQLALKEFAMSYVYCVDPISFGTINTNTSFPLNFAG